MKQLSVCSTASRVGGRKENQDNHGSANTPFGPLYVVCDGMGGGPGGRTASTVAVDAFIQYVQTAPANIAPADVLCDAVASANTQLQTLMQQTPQLQGMGTTIVALLLTPRAALVVHVGDSRLYQLHRGKMVFRTADHSLVGEMVRRGTLSEEQARLSAQSNIITRALGAGAAHEAEIDTVPYSSGDRFVLCSDGIWGSMSENQLLGKFAQKLSVHELVSTISADVDKIGIDKGGKHDNLTITAVDVNASSAMRPPGQSPLTRAITYLKHLFNH